jgi:hypothetical protein
LKELLTAKVVKGTAGKDAKKIFRGFFGTPHPREFITETTAAGTD